MNKIWHGWHGSGKRRGLKFCRKAKNGVGFVSSAY